jgi:hypothetical protein
MAHLDDTLRLVGEEVAEACHRRWNSLPHKLQIKKPHSPNALQFSLIRTTCYKEALRNLKKKWIGIRMNPHLLLHVAQMANINKEK